MIIARPMLRKVWFRENEKATDEGDGGVFSGRNIRGGDAARPLAGHKTAPHCAGYSSGRRIPSTCAHRGIRFLSRSLRSPEHAADQSPPYGVTVRFTDRTRLRGIGRRQPLIIRQGVGIVLVERLVVGIFVALIVVILFVVCVLVDGEPADVEQIGQ
jgi:hypothetical protein